jgi:hypothetical protein
VLSSLVLSPAPSPLFSALDCLLFSVASSTMRRFNPYSRGALHRQKVEPFRRAGPLVSEGGPDAHRITTVFHELTVINVMEEKLCTYDHASSSWAEVPR